jgi:hypothetical protein
VTGAFMVAAWASTSSAERHWVGRRSNRRNRSHSTETRAALCLMDNSCGLVRLVQVSRRRPQTSGRAHRLTVAAVNCSQSILRKNASTYFAAAVP